MSASMADIFVLLLLVLVSDAMRGDLETTAHWRVWAFIYFRFCFIFGFQCFFFFL